MCPQFFHICERLIVGPDQEIDRSLFLSLYISTVSAERRRLNLYCVHLAISPSTLISILEHALSKSRAKNARQACTHDPRGLRTADRQYADRIVGLAAVAAALADSQPRDDEDDDDFQPALTTGNTTDSRRETIRRQRIESVRRRRDAL
ncbi:hypothetical protein HD554DRAFT_1691178 [Boletus coccyginus]|nr:hypothetical protein HD554DRAFT_1691178 [Boletus coccyginus]